MKIKYILLSWDFITALLLAIVSFFALPYWVSSTFAKDIYGVGISVLSIVFSVYFAALAIIMSSSDDDFVKFLEEEKQYTTIISSFEFSLLVLFLALVYSLGLYAFTSFWLTNNCINQELWWMVAFTFLFFYGLFAAVSSTRDAINYSKYRTKFLNIKLNNEKTNHDSEQTN